MACQAIAAFESGCTGLLVPRESLGQLTSAAWPDEGDGSKPSEDVVRRWEEAKGRLLIKAVDTVEQLAVFYFPALAGKGRKRPRRGSGGAADAAVKGEDVGPTSVVRVPLWELNETGVVEACLVPGLEQPVGRMEEGRAFEEADS